MTGPFLLLALAVAPALTVHVASQPALSVPPGAQRVEMLLLKLSASCGGNVDVHGISVTHGGMGAIRDIASVYAMSDGQRISRGRALSSADGTVALTFRPALTVSACGEREIAIMADSSADAAVSGEHRITLRSPGDVDAGSVPVSYEAVTGAPVRRTVGVTQGSVTAEFLPLLTRVIYGDHRTVSRLRLSASGEFDQSVDAVTLTNDGSARDANLQHLTLETSRGQVLARLASLRGDRAPFVLSPPLTITRGQVLLLSVRANVRAGRSRTIGFILEEPGDVVSHRLRTRR